MSTKNEEVKNQPEAAPEEKAGKSAKKVRGAEKRVRGYQTSILRLIVVLLIVWVLFFKVVGVTHAPNDDMFPRLDGGDLVLYYRLDNNIRSQDVVVVQVATPDSPDRKLMYIGRVVAMPGDTVEISDEERLIINGNAVLESKIFYSTPRYEGFTEYPLTLGPNEHFLLVDSRQGGTDSRYYGAVDSSDILGTAITVMRRNKL